MSSVGGSRRAIAWKMKNENEGYTCSGNSHTAFTTV